MPEIRISTLIDAPPERVFDLSRSVDLHQVSTTWSQERAIAGRTQGLLLAKEQVTWEARHFGIRQQLTSEITVFDRPHLFVDEMVSGAFAGFRHEHHFAETDGGCTMTDVFDYTSPLGPLGRLADILFLESYMRRLLLIRNKTIKAYAESERWREVEGLS